MTEHICPESPSDLSGLIQIDSVLVNRLIDLRLTAAEWSLYMYVNALVASRDRGYPLPSAKQIMARLDIAKSTFYRALEKLQNEGLIPELVTLRPKGSGYVYLINAEGTAKYKIGKAENITTRLIALQHQSPVRLRLIHVIESDQPFKTEAILHNDYKACRLHGEWFELSQEHVAAIKQIDCTHEGEPLVSY